MKFMILALTAAFVLVLIVGATLKAADELTPEETEAVQNQLVKVEEYLIPLPSGKSGEIYQAYQLLLIILKMEGLESSSPKLAAKAHRSMAGLYYLVGLGMYKPPLTPPKTKAQVSLAKLEPVARRKLIKHTEDSLRLDPNQPDSSELRKAKEHIKKYGFTIDKLAEYMALFVPRVSVKK